MSIRRKQDRDLMGWCNEHDVHVDGELDEFVLKHIVAFMVNSYTFNKYVVVI